MCACACARLVLPACACSWRHCVRRSRNQRSKLSRGVPASARRGQVRPSTKALGVRLCTEAGASQQMLFALWSFLFCSALLLSPLSFRTEANALFSSLLSSSSLSCSTSLRSLPPLPPLHCVEPSIPSSPPRLSHLPPPCMPCPPSGRSPHRNRRTWAVEHAGPGGGGAQRLEPDSARRRQEARSACSDAVPRLVSARLCSLISIPPLVSRLSSLVSPPSTLLLPTLCSLLRAFSSIMHPSCYRRSLAQSRCGAPGQLRTRPYIIQSMWTAAYNRRPMRVDSLAPTGYPAKATGTNYKQTGSAEAGDSACPCGSTAGSWNQLFCGFSSPVSSN